MARQLGTISKQPEALSDHTFVYMALLRIGTRGIFRRRVC